MNSIKSIRIAIAQMNPTVGDYAGNAQKIMDWIQQAERKEADLIVFPEVALSGYPIWDLANKKRFVKEGLCHLKQIVHATKKMKLSVILGFVDESQKGASRSYNALAWIEKGKIRLKQYKRLLPNYDVFLERIFFEPGKKSDVLNWHGLCVGPMICEDIWDQTYEEKPIQDLRNQGAEWIINISASPFYGSVAATRETLLSRQAKKMGVPILYVNQVGGQDDLIFDGRSLMVDSKGNIIFRGEPFQENLYFFDWQPHAKTKSLPRSSQTLDPSELYQALVLGIKDYCRKNRFKKVLIGLSGGIDSALVAALATDALGPDAVTGVTMPGNYSSEGSWKDSEELAKRLGIHFRKFPIQEDYEAFVRRMEKHTSDLSALPSTVSPAMENLQARLRGLTLMYLSNKEGHLLLSTGNKSELAMGYCTLYGDMAGGLCVLGDVYKTEVYRLSNYRNQIHEVIPQVIIDKAPSAELRPDQKDQDSLPAYEVLDEILYLYIEKNLSRDEIEKKLARRNYSSALIHEIVKKVDHNEYKRRQTPPVLRITSKAWFGRRMPITNRFEN